MLLIECHPHRGTIKPFDTLRTDIKIDQDVSEDVMESIKVAVHIYNMPDNQLIEEVP